MDSFLLIKSIFIGLWNIVKGFIWLFIPVILVLLVFLGMISYFYIKEVYVNHRKPKGRTKIPKKPGIFKRLFILAPKQIVEDLITQDPNAFDKFGIHIICGEQGSGKTITGIYLMEEWKRIYPKLQCYTNLEYKYQNGVLDGPEDLFKHNNGIYGVVNFLDEIQTWWSSADSAKMPPKVLEEICQQRKQKKATIGTVQVFKRMSKAFREQAHFVYEPKTFLNCITFVRCTKGKYFSESSEKFKKYTGFFFFVHTKRLRNSYDTYKKIEKYKTTKWETSPYVANGEAPLEVSICDIK